MASPRPRSTLVTSPRSQADFAVRLIFFAVAPLAIVRVAAFFPVAGTLVNTGVALLGFVAGEAIRKRAARWPIAGRLLAKEFALEAYYRAHPPRPFLYYVFYPVLFPYWLVVGEARREAWLFKGYTLASIAVLLATQAYQFFAYWPPELGIADFAPVLAYTLAIDALLVLALLMPIATTVVGFHQTMRRGRLVALLLVGLVSTGIAIVRIARRREPVVSYVTRERVRLRTSAAKSKAQAAHAAALRAAWSAVRSAPGSSDGDGRLEGAPLDRARDALETFYKRDEAFAFDLWASPRKNPEIVVLYFEARGGHPSIWVAMDRRGDTVADPKKLPHGAAVAMRQAAP